MIKSIRSRLRKTPLQNKSTLLKEIEAVDQSVINPLLSSHLLGEGIYGFESVSGKNVNEQFLIAPSFMRKFVGRESHRDYSYLLNDVSNLYCYDIVLSEQSFLPLYTEESTSLIQQFQLIQSNDNEIYVQFLFSKRSDTWQYELIEQYKSYLDGNDFPSTSKLGRKFQGKMLVLVDKLGNFDSKRNEIEEISQKILENGYRFELRVVIYEENHEKLERIELEIEEILKEMDFFNELQLVKRRNKKQFLDCFLNRKFSELSRNQMICETELVCMVSDIEVTRESATIEEVIQQAKQETVNNISHKSRFDLLPIGEKKNREIDQEIVAALPMALKKAKATKTDKIEILDVELGATVQRITFKIPNNHVYSDIKGKYEDIKSTLGTELSIIQGTEPNTVTFLIPCKEREIIYLKEVLEDKEFVKFAQKYPLPFICGIDMYNKPVYNCLTNAPHLLVAGATNSGKSVFVNSLLITLILLKSPQELRLFLIDPKQVEFSQYEGFAHVEKVITDMKRATSVLDTLINEMEDRYNEFSKIKVRDIKSYNEKSKVKLPYIVCAIDEFNDLLMVSSSEVESKIERLGQKARGAGIHLIIATQRPDKNVMSGVIKTNLPSRISFSLNDNNEYRTVFGTGIPFKNLQGRGDGVVKYSGQTEDFIRFQAPVISLDQKEEENAYELIKGVYEGADIRSLELVENAQIEPIDMLKSLILEHNETRVAELQKLMGISINKVNDLMKRLVLRGFLKKVNNKYEIANEKVAE